MRKAIKFLIALFFIIGSFLLGKYFNLKAADELNDKLELYNRQVDSIKSENVQLRDSISILKNYNDSLYLILYTSQNDQKHH